MPDFAVIRIAKIKSAVSLQNASKHNTREKVPKNALPERLKANQIEVCKTTKQVMDLYNKKIPEKVRKNAVHALEFIITASHDYQGDWGKYFDDSVNWLEKNFGGKGNLLQIAMHGDEKTPHLHVLLMPLLDGKLNAKHYIGGHRDRMIDLQDSFWEEVGKKNGLNRGVEKQASKTKHNASTLKHEFKNLEAEKITFNKKVAELKKVEDELKADYNFEYRKIVFGIGESQKQEDLNYWIGEARKKVLKKQKDKENDYERLRK